MDELDLPSPEDYEDFVRDTAFFPSDYVTQETGGVIYTGLAINGEAGEVADQIKKMIRDDHGVLLPGRTFQIIMELGDVFWYAVALANELGWAANEVEFVNVVKLRARRSGLSKQAVEAACAEAFQAIEESHS